MSRPVNFYISRIEILLLFRYCNNVPEEAYVYLSQTRRLNKEK